MSDGPNQLEKEFRESRNILFRMAKILKLLGEKLEKTDSINESIEYIIRENETELSDNDFNLVEKLSNKDSDSWMRFVFILLRETHFTEDERVFLFIQKKWPFSGILIAAGYSSFDTGFDLLNEKYSFGEKRLVKMLSFSKQLVMEKKVEKGIHIYFIFLDGAYLRCYLSE